MPKQLLFVAFAILVTGFSPAASAASDQTPAAPQSSGRAAGPRQDRSPNEGGLPRIPKWWADADIQRELGLTEDKVRQIDALYQRHGQEVKPWVDDFYRQLDKLNKMTSDRVADESAYTMQVSRVEDLRSRLGEKRTVMLYRTFRELTPEQYQKLQEIFARWSSRGRGGSGR